MLQTADDVKTELAKRINIEGVEVAREGENLCVTYKPKAGRKLELTLSAFALSGADLHNALRQAVNVVARDVTQARQHEPED